jgi:hypothetical protein
LPFWTETCEPLEDKRKIPVGLLGRLWACQYKTVLHIHKYTHILTPIHSFIHSFIHFIFHISIYRLNAKDVEIVIVVVTVSGKE